MILVCSLCKDEMGRYLQDVVPIWKDFADHVLVIDDHSTDGSYEYLEEQGCDVIRNYVGPMWEHEGGIRQLLWDIATHDYPQFKWLLWLDADMYPANGPTERLLAASHVDSAAFHYVDLWGDGVFREDEWWSAHLRPRVWAVKNPGPNEHEVADREWHSGHIPMKAWGRVGVLPPEFSLMHLAYATEGGRQRQYQKYKALWEKGSLTPAEWEHAQTIIDPEPTVHPVPFDQQYRVTP